jgi:hypothetical protein
MDMMVAEHPELPDPSGSYLTRARSWWIEGNYACIAGDHHRRVIQTPAGWQAV